MLRLQQAVAGIPVHSSASSAAAVGNGRHHLRLGRPLWAGPLHTPSPCPCEPCPWPCQIAPYRRPLPIHPANPPARQILSIHSTLGAFPVFTCPSALPTLSLHSAASTSLCFSFSFPTPPTTRTPRAPLPFFSLRPCCLRFQKSILSRAFCRRSIALAVGPCLQSSSTHSTTPPSRLDPPDPRASSTPPDENTRRACCLLFSRVSFVLSPLPLDCWCFPCLWCSAWNRVHADLDPDLALRRRPGPGREPGRGPGCGLGLGLEDMGWIM